MPEVYSKLAGISAATAVPLNTAGQVYQSPVSPATSTIVKSIRLVNTSTTTATTIKLWHHSSNTITTVSSADLPYVILPAISIDAGGFAEFDGTLTMASGETLYAQAGLATITVTVYGVQLT